MKKHKTMRGGFTLVELLVVVVIIAALAGLALPQVMKYRKKADSTQASSNVRQIGMAMLEFETAYSSFPDESTVEQVQQNTQTQLSLAGNTANAYFRQLLATEMAPSEEIFYAKAAYSKKPDNIFNSSARALEAGEVGFGYIMTGNNRALRSAGNPARPIIAAPLAYPFSDGQFDPDVYDANAIVLRLDNSVQALPIIRTSKRAVLPGGKHLLQSGAEDTVWGTGVSPKMVNPDPVQ